MTEYSENIQETSTITKNLFSYALRRLAQREYGEEELRRKLLLSAADPYHVDIVIAQMKQAGHLSDERFVEEYIQSRIRRGFGPIRISAELHEKGIHADIINEALSIWQSSWASLAQRALEKKYGERMRMMTQTSTAAEKKTLRLAQKRFLLYRGFESNTIHETLHKKTSR